MLIKTPTKHSVSDHNSIIAKSRIQARGEVRNAKKRLISLKEPNFKINGILASKRVSANKYIIRLTANNTETARIVARKLATFNDMDIRYSPELDASDLIAISKKPLWNMTMNADGTYSLTRQF